MSNYLQISKKCPFCCGEGVLTSSYSHSWESYYVFVKCSICGASSKSFPEEKDPKIRNWETESCLDAIKAWNTRPITEKDFLMELVKIMSNKNEESDSQDQKESSKSAQNDKGEK